MCLYILGQGGHASSIRDALIAGGLKIFKCVNDECFELPEAQKNKWILGFGDLKARRKKISSPTNEKICYANVFHPTAVISPSSFIGKGVFIGANAYIGPNTVIEDHCIINTHAVIEHDCEIGENVHISVNSTLCGKVHVGKDTFIGAGTTIIPKIVISSNVYIGAGIKVGQDLPSYHFYNGISPPTLRKSCIKKWKWCAIKPLCMQSVSSILQKSIQHNHFTNNGPVVKELEAFIKDKFKLNNEVHMTSSGTAALHALIASLNIFQNRILKFATQAFTFPSAILGPLKNSMVIDNDTECLGPSMEVLEERKNDFDGIIITNVFGCICNIMKYRQWCDKNSKLLLFDSAATPMAFLSNTNVCDIADASIISFHETKFFGRGEGGAIICSKNLWPYVNRAVNFGFDFGEVVRKFHIEASNWRMSDFSAAFILSYLRFIFEPENIEGAFRFSKKVKEIIAESDIFSFLFHYPDKTVLSGICLYCKYPISSEMIKNLSETTRIELKKYYVPLTSKKNAPNAWVFYEHVLCIPFHFQISENDVVEMIEILTRNIFCIGFNKTSLDEIPEHG